MNIYTKKQPSHWYCDNCQGTIWEGEFRYNCTICTDYDYCKQCMKTKDPPHPHQMIQEFSYGPISDNGIVPVDMAAGIEKALKIFSNRYCMGTRDFDETNPSVYIDSYSWITYKTIGNRTKNFGNGLRHLIEPRGYLAICAANRPEWLITDFACMLQSFISVPIYCLFDNREIAFVINNTQVSVVVCDKQMLPRFIQLGAECPSLRRIVCMDPICETIKAQAHANRFTLHYMGDIENLGSTKKYGRVMIKPTDCLTIIYTSGSSGFPKGSIISEEAYRETFRNWFISYNFDRVTFAYRPFAWASDRDASIGTFISGGRIGFSTGDVNRLMEELALVRPTSFAAPPSIWNKIYAEFKTACSLINVHHSVEARAIKEKRLLEQFSKLIPTRCESIQVGGAKVSPAVFNFMKRCFSKCRINESYGITECGSVAYNQAVENDIKYRLESVPEMGYTIDDKPYPRGEILTKTKQMFSGYMNNPEETRAAVTDDGYFRTGDIVELRTNSDGKPDMHVIDRKKSFFKLSQGQFVSPEYLQSIYIQSSFVEQIYIHGDLLSDSVAAVVVPNRAYAQTFALEHNIINFDMHNPNSQFCDAVLNDLRSIATKESLRKHEFPSHLVVDFEPFTPENGLLTSSFKPCRHKLAVYYADRLKASKTIDQRLKTIIETATGQSISKDDEEHLLISNGNDSLTAVRLSRMIENNFGVPVPISILFEPTMTLQRLTSLIKDPAQLSSMSHSIVPQLLNDSQLDLNINMNECKKTTCSPSLIFITGTTGFVGAFLLAELLRVYPFDCKFVCLVRCESSATALDRIRKNMLFYQIWEENYEKRIIPLKGDLAKTYFGLDSETYESLAKQIDIIFHCGATVNFVLPYSQLYGPNVCGTREIIRLATYSSICIPVQYISTLSVLSSGINMEISIDKIPPDGLVGGYGQSKWVAEKLITKASQLGLPVVIYRLGSICAATGTGACNINDIHTLLLASIMKLGCYRGTQINTHLHGLPVDFTAKTIVYLSRLTSDINGKIYHVLNSHSKIPFKNIVDSIQYSGVQLEKVSYEEWRLKLKTITHQGNPFESAEEFLLESAFNEGLPISADQYYNAISQLSFPQLDKDYVFKWLKFVFLKMSENMQACNDNFHSDMLFKYSSTYNNDLIHRATRQGRVFSLETYLNRYSLENIDQLFIYGRSKWTLLIAACFYKHENIVRMLLRRFKPDINATGDVKLDFVHEVMYGVSALWVAAAVGSFDIVKLLIEEGNANVNHLSITRSSPLRAASYIGRLDIAQYLISHGADMQLVRDGNYTNFMLSAYRGHIHMLTYFLHELKCNPNEYDQDGRTSLHYAIDGGSLDVIQLLLEHGAKNISVNVITPLMWAALEAREDLVDAFENYCSSDLEWIEGRELLAASYANIESRNYNLDKAIEHMTKAYKWRQEKNLPKTISSNLFIEAYNYSHECQTLNQFNQLISESNTELHIESLRIQERILGQKNKRYRHSIRFYGTILADIQQYDISLRFWLYELDLRKQHKINFDKWHLRDFVHIFAEMIINDLDHISEKAILEILNALNNELSNGRHNDHNLLTIFYLITVISHISDKQRFSSSMNEIYRILVMSVKSCYITTENLSCWTLLHLSMMTGLSCVNDSHIMALCKYPCYNTVRLLLQCGANIDAIDLKRNTPLHLIAQRNDDIENILFIINLLCDTGRAHPDCVNDNGQTPLESATNTHVKVHLRKKIGVGQLKCLCARLIRKQKISFKHNQFSSLLVNFIEKH
ncbi:unnamed protein product [Adineta steineri]|uniref:long-chain-fatty-acid--CoA ligase n=1 Tax=Adineta steineri TaxID=433720 RepID=A0A818PZP7_9BILA|nr:unnamed protein product [Adineta steineri]